MAKLSSIPRQHPTKLVDFHRLDGGLNLWELDYRLDLNQTPEMKNLWWEDGVLQCRSGQSYLIAPPSLGTGHTCFSELFWNHAFFHIGDGLYCVDMSSEVYEAPGEALPNALSYRRLCSGVAQLRGTFFRYGDHLYYKNKGGFFKIAYDPAVTGLFTVTDAAENAFVPVLSINTDPATGAGDLYQPENRLSPMKKVQYNAATTGETVQKTGDGTTKVFSLGVSSSSGDLASVKAVYFGATLVSETLYTVDLSAGTVTFLTAPEANTAITFDLRIGVKVYQLPISGLDAVTEVVVDGVKKTAGTDYSVNLSTGVITFTTPPPVHNPAVNNTVEVTLSKANDQARKAIMDCTYVIVYGGDQNVCIVMAGSDAQPNAIFWSGNDSVGLNSSYWPMTHYNLAGDTEDRVTGFGKQYGELLVLKERSVGKVSYSVETVEGRNSVSLVYAGINSKIGCDLPWSIQLIENNVVFCSTYGGVYIVRDSSAAYENNIECISRNVNGTEQRPGLLEDVRADQGGVCSFDDDNRYWLCANGHVYAWDYLLSSVQKPSWFYFTDIHGVAYLRTVNKSYHLNAAGGLTEFLRSFMDYEGAIEKVYQFPPQFFGTYDRLKDIQYVILTVRSDTDSVAQIQYQSDYEIRYDQTDIRAGSWKLSPRNLTYRFLGVQRYAHVARRKPGCRHVRHFSMRLSNAVSAQDLAIISAQIYFKYLGRDR